MKWIYQHSDWGLGNFINVTPIIKRLYEESGERVPVYFESKFIELAYEDSHMIEILKEMPEDDPVISSRCHCVDNSEEDYKYNYRVVFEEEWNEDYKPFIGGSPYDPTYKGIKRAVIICGSGSEDPEYLNSKIPSLEVYAEICQILWDQGWGIQFVGSFSDWRRLNVLQSKYPIITTIGDIKMALFDLQMAEIVIGNDTGLIHAAGCFDIDTFVMWKDTPFPRCWNSGKYTVYSEEGNWINDFKEFIKDR